MSISALELNALQDPVLSEKGKQQNSVHVTICMGGDMPYTCVTISKKLPKKLVAMATRKNDGTLSSLLSFLLYTIYY
jgi:hypothetical protein